MIQLQTIRSTTTTALLSVLLSGCLYGDLNSDPHKPGGFWDTAIDPSPDLSQPDAGTSVAEDMRPDPEDMRPATEDMRMGPFERLYATRPYPAGDACSRGGEAEVTGKDRDQDGELQDDEIDEDLTRVRCNWDPASNASLAIGWRHNCVIDTFGQGWCWGSNQFYQTRAPGGGEFTDYITAPIELELRNEAKSMHAGVDHNCVITTSNEADCWGGNYSGQLARGTSTSNTSLTEVPGISDVAGLGLGWYHSCALIENGDVYCWGQNDLRQLGRPEFTDLINQIPTRISALPEMVKIAAGPTHTCTVEESGSVWCWGDNSEGQVGVTGETVQDAPFKLPNLSNIADIDAGYQHTCARTALGRVKCWGWNNWGQLGNGTEDNSATPVDVFGLEDVTEIAAGGFHTCALVESGDVYCWGQNDQGQLGTGDKDNRSLPQKLTSLADVVKLSAGLQHTCAMTRSGEIYCWGDNQDDQLAQDGVQYSTTPVEIIFRYPPPELPIHLDL